MVVMPALSVLYLDRIVGLLVVSNALRVFSLPLYRLCRAEAVRADDQGERRRGAGIQVRVAGEAGHELMGSRRDAGHGQCGAAVRVDRGRAQAHPEIPGDHAGAGVGDRRARQNREVRGGAERRWRRRVRRVRCRGDAAQCDRDGQGSRRSGTDDISRNDRWVTNSYHSAALFFWYFAVQTHCR